MSDYTRVNDYVAIQAAGTAVTGAHLNGEFNAIEGAVNDNAARIADLEDTGIVPWLNAADATYQPSGETDAQRVANAIIAASASGGAYNTVFVPKAMWGYVADVDFDSGMFTTSVMLIREGGPTDAYDPVAYGADTSGTEDSYDCIAAAAAGAAAGLVGPKVLMFAQAGTYKKGTDVSVAGLVVVTYAGITHTGAGAFTGTPAFSLDGVYNTASGTAAARPATGTRAGHAYVATDTNVLSVWDGAEWISINPPAPFTTGFFTYNTDAGAGSRAAAATVAKRLVMRVSGTASGGGAATVVLSGEAALSGYSLANYVYVVATENTRVGVTTGSSGGISVSVDAAAETVNLGSLGGGDTYEVFMEIGFSA